MEDHTAILKFSGIFVHMQHAYQSDLECEPSKPFNCRTSPVSYRVSQTKTTEMQIRNFFNRNWPQYHSLNERNTKSRRFSKTQDMTKSKAMCGDTCIQQSDSMLPMPNTDNLSKQHLITTLFSYK